MAQRWIDASSLWEEDPEPEAQDHYTDYEQRMKAFIKDVKPAPRKKGKRAPRSQMPM